MNCDKCYNNILKYHIADIIKNGFLFEHELRFASTEHIEEICDPLTDDWNIVYLSVKTPKQWINHIYIYFPITYPFSSPTIYFGNLGLQHDLIANSDGEVNLCNWVNGSTLRNLINNLYLILLESKF